jgi:glycerophosphoryl diester phosphodiesterase
MGADTPFLLIAHRGDSAHCIENTAEAFRSSIARGFRAIELDLMTLTDGMVVVFHDDDLRRLAGADVRADRLDLDRFRSLFPSLLTFADFAAEFGELDIEINLEIKDHVGTLNAVMGEAGRMKRVVVSSFHSGIVDRAVEEGMQGAYLFDKKIYLFYRKFIIKSSRIHIPWRFLEKVTDEAFRGFDVYCYTVNDPDVARRLMRLPFVKGIFTDRQDFIEMF